MRDPLVAKCATIVLQLSTDLQSLLHLLQFLCQSGTLHYVVKIFREIGPLPEMLPHKEQVVLRDILLDAVRCQDHAILRALLSHGFLRFELTYSAIDTAFRSNYTDTILVFMECG